MPRISLRVLRLRLCKNLLAALRQARVAASPTMTLYLELGCLDYRRAQHAAAVFPQSFLFPSRPGTPDSQIHGDFVATLRDLYA